MITLNALPALKVGRRAPSPPAIRF
jgi:hypothetical protein